MEDAEMNPFVRIRLAIQEGFICHMITYTGTANANYKIREHLRTSSYSFGCRDHNIGSVIMFLDERTIILSTSQIKTTTEFDQETATTATKGEQTEDKVSSNARVRRRC